MCAKTDRSHFFANVKIKNRVTVEENHGDAGQLCQSIAVMQNTNKMDHTIGIEPNTMLERSFDKEKRCITPESNNNGSGWDNVEELTLTGVDDLYYDLHEEKYLEECLEADLLQLQDLFQECTEAALLRQARSRTALGRLGNNNSKRHQHKRLSLKTQLKDSRWEQSVMHVLFLMLRFQVESPVTERDIELVRKVYEFRQRFRGCSEAVPSTDLLKIFKKVVSHGSCPPRLLLLPGAPAKKRRKLLFDGESRRNKAVANLRHLSERLASLAQAKRQERYRLMLDASLQDRSDMVERLKIETEQCEDQSEVLRVWVSLMRNDIFSSKHPLCCEEQVLLLEETVDSFSAADDCNEILKNFTQYVSMATTAPAPVESTV